MARAARRSLGQIRYVSPVPPRAARGLVAEVYAQAERDFGMLAPPMALHSPAPAVLAAAWVMLRETLLAGGAVSRAEKEAAAAAVSTANACPYCVSVHTAARQIAAGRIDQNAGRLGEIARYARCSSRPDPEGNAPARYFPELAGVAVTFHYLNRMVNVFLPGSLLPPRAPRVMGSVFMRVLGSVMLSADVAPGDTLDLLPVAPLPAEFGWAAAEPRVAAALSRAAAAIGLAGELVVPRPVRDLVLDRLSSWDGQPPGPSRGWAVAAAGDLAAADRAAGRLALLTAFASYQVGPAEIDDVRPLGDEGLIGLTAWASMAAARRIGSWRPEPVASAHDGTPGDAGTLPLLAPYLAGQPRRRKGRQ
jgi:alkylhydroperoxidase family enzyme